MKRFSDIINYEDVPLMEHRGEFVNSLATAHEFQKTSLLKLNEHRGQPDPQKVRERQEAHERGEERHKNAQQRRKQELQAALQRARQKAAKQRQQDLEATKNKEQSSKRQQELNNLDVKQQQQNQQQQQHQKVEQQKQQQKIQSQQKKEQLQTSANEQEALLEQETTDIIATAPTDTAKESAENLTKDVKEINEQIKSDLESDLKDKSDVEKQEIRTKKKKEIEYKYNKALEKAEKAMKTSEEKSWMNSSANKVFDRAKKVFDAWWELFGFKAITDPVKEVGQKYLGLNFEGSVKDSKQQKEKDRSKQAAKVAKQLGKNKQQRIKELQAQGYSRQEAEDILSDVMQRRTNGNSKQDYQNTDEQEEQDFEQQKQQKPKKEEKPEKKKFNPNDVESLRKLAVDSSAKKVLTDRLNKKSTIVSQYRKEGLSHDAALRKWYKETENLIS